MKKLGVLVTCLIVLISSCIIIAHFNKKDDSVPYLFFGALTAQRKENIYIVTVSNMGEGDKYVHFSNERNILKTKGIVPLKTGNMHIYVGMKMTDVIESYGEPHVDVGSGLYIPAYITEDAYLVSILLGNDGSVSSVLKEDLLRGTRGTLTFITFIIKP